MSVKNGVLGMVLVAFVSQVSADIPDGRGGRTSPQASQQQATQSVRKCCEKAMAGDCKALVTQKARRVIEPRVPPQRTEAIAPPLRCKHMPAAAGSIEGRVPPQRAALTPEPAARQACCEKPHCNHVS
jgi:hypothetical protein